MDAPGLANPYLPVAAGPPPVAARPRRRWVSPAVVGAVVTGTTFLGAGSAFADVIHCEPGQPCDGTERNDTIYGTAGDDDIDGRGGDDTIFGGRGNDGIDGGRGNDTLHGGQGKDLVRGGPGLDVLEGNSGNDKLWGEGGADQVTGGAGSDCAEYDAGDTVTGTEGTILGTGWLCGPGPAGGLPDPPQFVEPVSVPPSLSIPTQYAQPPQEVVPRPVPPLSAVPPERAGLQPYSEPPQIPAGEDPDSTPGTALPADYIDVATPEG